MFYKQFKSFIRITFINLIIIIILAVIMSVISCTKYIHPYNVIIKNTGTSKISHSQVMFGNKSIFGGWISPGQSATYSNPQVDIPEKAIVKWQRDNTKLEVMEVSVKNLLPPLSTTEEYNLIFSIDEEDNVKLIVTPCTSGQPCPERFK